MNINVNQLNYILEIYNARSISKAASNLFMAQSNLSRILRETEETIGFRIFDRSRQGIHPTEQGKLFLAKAERILDDITYIENIGKNPILDGEINICIPHSYSNMKTIMDYFSSKANISESLITINECSTTKTIENISSGLANIGIIRIFSEYSHYYEQRISENSIHSTLLNSSSFQIVVSNTSPLANLKEIDPAKLDDYICIASMSKKSPSRLSSSKTRISVTDRLTQLNFLSSIEKSFLWSEPLPKELLDKYDLVQISSIEPVFFQTLLLYKQSLAPGSTLSELIELIIQQYKK